MTKKSKKKPMSRTLIMHIGLPKTGTTMIQEFLKHNHEKFDKNGIGALSVDGQGTHAFLGNYLNELDGNIIQSKGYLTGYSSMSNYYPVWSNQSTYIISSEDMQKLGDRGVLSVLKYAQGANATIKVALTLRRPSEFIFSNWCQFIKSKYIDWISFVEESVESKVGFLSVSLRHWLAKNLVSSIVIVKHEKVNFLNNFLQRIGIGQFIPLDDSTSPFINVTSSMVEALYQAALVKEISHVLASNDRLDFLKYDIGYVQRILLDIADNASPVFEIANKHEDATLKDEAVLGYDSYESLSRYTKAWADDAKQFLQEAKPWLDVESIKIINQLVNESLVDAKQFINNTENFRKLPQKDFVELLPIDSQFIGLSRTLATSILLGNRSFNNISQNND